MPQIFEKILKMPEFERRFDEVETSLTAHDSSYFVYFLTLNPLHVSILPYL